MPGRGEPSPHAAPAPIAPVPERSTAHGPDLDPVARGSPAGTRDAGAEPRIERQLHDWRFRASAPRCAKLLDVRARQPACEVDQVRAQERGGCRRAPHGSPRAAGADCCSSMIPARPAGRYLRAQRARVAGSKRRLKPIQGAGWSAAIATASARSAAGGFSTSAGSPAAGSHFGVSAVLLSGRRDHDRVHAACGDQRRGRCHRHAAPVP